MLGGSDAADQTSPNCAGQCPAGYSCASEATTTPVQCPPGTYCPKGSTTAYPCPEGTSSATAGLGEISGCKTCAAGYLCALGTATPVLCPLGEYCPPGSARGLPCAAVLEGGTTALPGATSNATCDCKPGLFKQDGACLDGQATFAAAGVVDGIDFTQPGITLETLPLKPRYWRVSNVSLAVGKCYTEGVCTGATPGGGSSTAARRLQSAAPPSAARLQSEDTFGAALCRAGHEGPYCDVCSPHWYKAQDKLCYDCAAADGNVAANVTIAVGECHGASARSLSSHERSRGPPSHAPNSLARTPRVTHAPPHPRTLPAMPPPSPPGLFLGVFVVLVLFLCHGRKAAIAELLAGDVSEEGIESAIEGEAGGKASAISIRFLKARVRAKIYMSLIQVLSSIGTVFEIAFPPVFSGLMKWVGVLQLDIFSALPLDCVMTSSFHATLLLRTLVPLGVMLGLAAWGGWCLRAGNTSTPKGASRVWLGNVLFNLVFLILFFIYPSTSTKIFATFQCKDIGDGTRYLRADLAIDCDSPAHVGMLAYAIVMVLVYPLGAPALYAYLLFKLYGDQLWRLRDIENVRTSLALGAASEDQLSRWDTATGKAGGGGSDHSQGAQPRIEKLEAEEKALKAKLPGYMQTLSGSGYSLRVVRTQGLQPCQANP